MRGGGGKSRQNVIISQWLCHFGKQQLLRLLSLLLLNAECVQAPELVVQPWSPRGKRHCFIAIVAAADRFSRFNAPPVFSLQQTLLVNLLYDPPLAFFCPPVGGINRRATACPSGDTHGAIQKVVPRFIAVSPRVTDDWSVSSLRCGRSRYSPESVRGDEARDALRVRNGMRNVLPLLFLFTFSIF